MFVFGARYDAKVDVTTKIGGFGMSFVPPVLSRASSRSLLPQDNEAPAAAIALHHVARAGDQRGDFRD